MSSGCKGWPLLLVMALLTGCAMTVTPYGVSSQNLIELRQHAGSAVAVGAFTTTLKGTQELSCRTAARPIKTPKDEGFVGYIRSAFIDELRAANVYASTNRVKIEGRVDELDASSGWGTLVQNGHWKIGLTLTSTNGNSLSESVTVQMKTYNFTSDPCQLTASAFDGAVQQLIYKFVANPKFGSLLGVK